MTRINPHHPRRHQPSGHRVLGVEKAAAACGVALATLLDWVERGLGPVPYLIDSDDGAVAWTAEEVRPWRAQQRLAA